MMHTVFFDAGGTLITGTTTLTLLAQRLDHQRKDEIFEFMRQNFMRLYLDENPPQFYTIKELLTLCASLAVRHFHLPDIDYDIVGYYRRTHLQNDRLYDDTLPTLKRLREKGIRLILISDADADVLLEQLEIFGISEYFDGKIISSQTCSYKPSDKTVKEALRYCHEPLSGILLVGDTVVDIKTAQKMGVKSALISRTNDFKLDTHYKIASLFQVINIISETKDDFS